MSEKSGSLWSNSHQQFIMEKSVHLSVLLVSVICLCGHVLSKNGGGAQTPPRFLEHTGEIDSSNSICSCSYNDSICTYINAFPQGGPWSIVVNKDEKQIIDSDGSINVDAINSVVVQSDILNGVKCLFLSVSTNRHHINWALSVRNPHRETLVGLAGNLKHSKKITVGLASTKPYIISFYLYGFQEHERPTEGGAYIGDLELVDGPCAEDVPSLNCTFDSDFCNWDQHNPKYVWYNVPFGLHHTIPHAIEYGALGAFAGKGNLWSPLVRTVNVKCFSFIYAKSESTDSHLRVWLLYRIPGGKDVSVLLYEDAGSHKILKKEVQISIFVPFDFQIGFEGRSKTIMHGVFVLHTAIGDHSCEGTGSYLNIKDEDSAPEITTQDPDDLTSTTLKVTTPTTPFGPR